MDPWSSGYDISLTQTRSVVPKRLRFLYREDPRFEYKGSLPLSTLSLRAIESPGGSISFSLLIFSKLLHKKYKVTIFRDFR